VLPHTPRKRYRGLRYNTTAKLAFDAVVGQDSFEMLNDKVQHYMTLTLRYVTQSRKNFSSHHEAKEFMVQDFASRISKCAMVKYFMQEMQIPYEQGIEFFAQIADELYSENLGLRRYLQLLFDTDAPVRLLWDGQRYHVKYRGETKTLDCETTIIMGKWAVNYNQFEEVSPWNNGTFNIFIYDLQSNRLIDHPSAIIDHYLLFNHHWEDGVLFADNLARFVEYQFSDLTEDQQQYTQEDWEEDNA